MLKLKIRRQHYCHARSQSLAQFRFLAKAERPLIILGKARRIHKLMNSFVNLLKSTQIPFLPMSMAKGILKIRIHFLRQLRVRLPRQMLTLSCLLVHD
ncbi:hypothetical protein ACP0HM_12650 [Escherichia coli]